MSTHAQTGGDVAILGAGIIGLSIAFELAQRAASVRVYDVAEPARAASWAAAGMLAPRTEHMPDDALRDLCECSLELYPDFAARVQAASSVDPHLRLNGILHAAFSQEEFAHLQERCELLRNAGHRARALDREETLMAEPLLGKYVMGSLLVEGEGQIDNRRLGRALLAACEGSDVRIETGLRNIALECDSRRVLGLRTDAGFVPAGAVVNAAGAWAAAVPGVPPQLVPPVRPVKGQMLAITLPAGAMRHTTWVPRAYLVPRSDGRLLVGATSEEAGFDTRVTAGALESLLHAALAAAPALRDFTVTESWAGLRPGSPDERPFLGPTALQGYYLATGHYRNGILLAPATARLLSRAIAGEQPQALTPFSIERFGTKLADISRTKSA
jgi:glycine oxidase